MASITTRSNKTFVLQFFQGGKRRTLNFPAGVRRGEVEIFKHHIEHILLKDEYGAPWNGATEEWVASLGQAMRARLASLGLPVTLPPATVDELGGWTLEYLKKKGRKDSTIRNVELSRRNLKEFFGDRRLGTLTVGDAEDFRLHLLSTGLAKSTVSRRCRRARQIFERAVTEGWMRRNPFAEMGDWDETNPAREVYIPPQDVLDLIAKAKPEFGLLLAMVRFAGLRCPSELKPMQSSQIGDGVLTVLSPKTERLPEGASRRVPISYEVEQALALWRPQGLVFPGYQGTRTAIANALERLCRRAGVAMWPKPYQNMRASFENDLWATGFSIDLVSGWMGHSAAVALKHYRRHRNGQDVDAAAQVLRKPGWRK